IVPEDAAALDRARRLGCVSSAARRPAVDAARGPDSARAARFARERAGTHAAPGLEPGWLAAARERLEPSVPARRRGSAAAGIAGRARPAGPRRDARGGCVESERARDLRRRLGAAR